MAVSPFLVNFLTFVFKRPLYEPGNHRRIIKDFHPLVFSRKRSYPDKVRIRSRRSVFYFFDLFRYYRFLR